MTRSLSLSNGIRRVYGAFTQKDGREKLDVTSYLFTSLFQSLNMLCTCRIHQVKDTTRRANLLANSQQESKAMATAPVKKAAHDLIDQLPDDISWDDLAYKIEVRASIERGLADAAAGRTTSQEDIEKLFGVTR